MYYTPLDYTILLLGVNQPCFSFAEDEVNDEDTTNSCDVIASKDSDDVSSKSVWNCDGEILPDPKIRVKVHCQILPVFARGLEKHVSEQ